MSFVGLSFYSARNADVEELKVSCLLIAALRIVEERPLEDFHVELMAKRCMETCRNCDPAEGFNSFSNQRTHLGCCRGHMTLPERKKMLWKARLALQNQAAEWFLINRIIRMCGDHLWSQSCLNNLSFSSSGGTSARGWIILISAGTHGMKSNSAESEKYGGTASWEETDWPLWIVC